ncbi:MAG TPA: FeoB-associated Cys-rich membrane protein [Ohtaekwangia sp.]
MIQQLLVGLIFAGALFYVGRLIYKSFQSKSACTSGCGKCGVVDFQKIEKQIQKEKLI